MFSHSLYHWLIYLLQFHCNIYFVMWDPESIDIEMLCVAFAYKFQVCIHLIMDRNM